MLETGTGGFPAQLPSMPGAPAFSDEFDLDIRLGAAGKKPHDICEGTEDGTTCAAECEDDTEGCLTEAACGATRACPTVGCETEVCTKATCNQNTCHTCQTKCEQKTCAATCETCNTNCKQQTCATCETKCEQHTCAKTCVTCKGETCIECTVACTHANTCDEPGCLR